MAKVFGGTDSWLQDFVESDVAVSNEREALASWEDDVIQAVKRQQYSSLDEALADLKHRTGITQTAVAQMKKGIAKKVAFDREWHNSLGTTSPELLKTSEVKTKLIQVANDLDLKGEIALANAVDRIVNKLP